MSVGPFVRRALQIVGAIVFIALSALSASRARSDPLTEACVLGLIAIGAAVFRRTRRALRGDGRPGPRR